MNHFPTRWTVDAPPAIGFGRFLTSIILGVVTGLVVVVAMELLLGWDGPESVVVACLVGAFVTILWMFRGRERRRMNIVTPVRVRGSSDRFADRRRSGIAFPSTRGTSRRWSRPARLDVGAHRARRVSSPRPETDGRSRERVPPKRRSWLKRLVDWFRRCFHRAPGATEASSVDPTPQGVRGVRVVRVRGRSVPADSPSGDAARVAAGRSVEGDRDVAASVSTVERSQTTADGAAAAQEDWWSGTGSDAAANPGDSDLEDPEVHGQLQQSSTALNSEKKNQQSGQLVGVASLKAVKGAIERPDAANPHPPYLFVGKFIRVRNPRSGSSTRT
ncbi:hypothetical protein OAF82_01105 [bacterium]|nr:hypothetical protein [bacterium]